MAFFGLSAFIISQSTVLFISNKVLDVRDFLLCIALSCAVLNVTSMLFLRQYDIDILELLPEERSPLLLRTQSSDFYIQEEPEAFESSNDLISDLVGNSDSDSHNEGSGKIVLEEISCFSSVSAYLLAFNMFVIVGAGLMYINNVGAIIRSLAPNASESALHESQILHVSLLSLLSFASRILVGVCADISNQYIGIHYTFWAFVSSAVMALAFFISATV